MWPNIPTAKTAVEKTIIKIFVIGNSTCIIFSKPCIIIIMTIIMKYIRFIQCCQSDEQMMYVALWLEVVE